MNTQSGIESDMALIGQAQIWRYLYGALDAMALRCCVELGIADIISNHNRPTTLSEIATGIDSPSINVDGLGRLMRFLVHRKVFDEEDGEGNTLYSLNHCSKLLLSNTNMSMAPSVMMLTNPFMGLATYGLSRSIKEGGTAFTLSNGEEFFDLLSNNSEINSIFNEAMASTMITMDAIISGYKNGFLGLKGSMVDVGGGIGVTLSGIVKAYPHLKGINFDLPHVISTAPSYDGVTHVAGHMFKSIPPAETILLKTILHNWGHDDCVKILQNYRKTLPKETGRVIIVEIVLHPTGDDPFNYTRVAFDLAMFTCFPGGRERNEDEWKKLLNECGFCRYNIIKIPSFLWIIEAFP